MFCCRRYLYYRCTFRLFFIERAPKSRQKAKNTSKSFTIEFYCVSKPHSRDYWIELPSHHILHDTNGFISALEPNSTWLGGVKEVSYAYAYIGLLVAFFQGVLVGPLTKNLGEPRVLLIGVISLSIGLMMLTLANNVWVFAFDAILLCAGTSLCHPTLAAIGSQRTPDAHQGTVMGTFNSVAAFGRIFSPPIGGAVFIQLGANWPLIFAGLVMLPVVGAAAWTSLRAKL